jgi:hypothetical protein
MAHAAQLTREQAQPKILEFFIVANDLPITDAGPSFAFGTWLRTDRAITLDKGVELARYTEGMADGQSMLIPPPFSQSMPSSFELGQENGLRH